MDHEKVAGYFTRSDGTYLFARWGRPIAPVVFGVEDATLATVKGAIEAVVALAGHQMTETDPELGANLLMFFFRDWNELVETPNLDRLVPDLGALVERLKEADANQYRLFRFDTAKAIKAAFVFVRMDAEMSKVPAEDVALAQAAQSILLWSDAAFQDRGMLVSAEGKTLLNPDIAALIRAGYDPILPAAADDAAHALRLAARVSVELRNT